MGTKLAVHLLGAGDLGVPPREAAQQIRRFREAGRGERLEMLRSVRDEDHYRMSPLRSLLAAHVDAERVLLVATDQEPPHEGDTAVVAGVIADLSQDDRRDVYGRDFDPEVCLVRDFSIQGFARALRDHLTDRPEITEVVLGLGGGVTPFTGLLVGALEGGVSPLVCETNRQDRTIDTFRLAVEHDPDTWLVRLGLLTAMAERHPHQPSWQLAEALQRLHWLQTQAAAEQAGRDVAVPSGKCLSPPSQSHEWTWYRSVLQSVLSRRIGRGETDGLLLAQSWVQTRTAELLQSQGVGGHPPEHLAQEWIQRDSDPATAHRWHQLDKGLERHHPEVHQFLVRSKEDLWDYGSSTSHCAHRWRVSLPSRAPLVVREQVLPTAGSDPIADVLTDLGHPRWPLVRSTDVIVFHCVGKQNIQSDGSSPMLDAVLSDLVERLPALPHGRPPTCHLEAISSPATTDLAHQVTQLALATRAFGSAAVCETSPYDYAAAQQAVYTHASSRLDELEAGGVIALVGPGTKAMNLGMVAGAVQAAFDALVPVSVGSLLRQGVATTRLDWSPGPDHRVFARLAHDDVVASALGPLVGTLDLGAARRVLDAASPAWRAVAHEVWRLDMLMFGSRQELSPVALRDRLGGDAISHEFLEPAALWAARASMLGEVADVDPWRSIYLAACLAEHAFDPGWKRSGNATRRLWGWRNDSPLGHKPWACPPMGDWVRDTIASSIRELEQQDHVPRQRLEPRVLEVLWRGLRRELEGRTPDR